MNALCPLPPLQTLPPAAQPVAPLRLLARTDDTATARQGDLAEEVPVAMVFNGSSVAVMMATPEHIEDFAYGFALTEGFIASPADVAEFELLSHDSGIEARFWLHDAPAAALAERRRTLAGPIGCGLCGIDSLDQALRAVPRVTDPAATPLRLGEQDLLDAPDALRAAQPLHDRCHAVHAAGFWLPGHGIFAAREDVGRHNALDKLIGALLRQGIDPARGAMVVTSRLSVDLVQKCAMAGAPVLIAVSAPTAHAVRIAERAGITLVARARAGRAACYSHPERIAP